MAAPQMRWANVGEDRGPGWDIAWAQIIGIYHKSGTEDSVKHRFHWRERSATAFVCDGVGGGSRGDVASRSCAGFCTAAPIEAFGDPAALRKWLDCLEPEVQQELLKVTPYAGATTMVGVWIGDNGIGHLIRVGDSRAYIFEDGVATCVTYDQTYGFVGETPPDGGSLEDPARMVGTGCTGLFELQDFQLKIGQTLVLGTDGLHKWLSESQIAWILSTCMDPSDAAMVLCAAALDAGSDDDISVLVLRRSVEHDVGPVRRALAFLRKHFLPTRSKCNHDECR